jgi:putative ABC transport system permease protein
MSLWRTVKVAWEGLTLNKGRSVLTMLGVIIGVASVIVMMAVSSGAEAEIADQINALGAWASEEGCRGRAQAPWPAARLAA